MIELIGSTLNARFPEVHPEAECQISFQRTLRVPDDGREYPLPAGLGRFPLFCVEDYPVPAEWKRRGGVFMPMYQSEAMWLNFEVRSVYPFALKIAAGKINAVTGSAWANPLSGEPQDYVVLPEQRWIDGFYVAKGSVRQFVAAPLGDGITVEEQLTGKAEFGGVQVLVVPMKAEVYRDSIEVPRRLEQEIESLSGKLSEAFRDLEPMIERAEERISALAKVLERAHQVLAEARDSRHKQAARDEMREAEESLRKAVAFKELWERQYAPSRRNESRLRYSLARQDGPSFLCKEGADFAMGLGTGGVIRQEIAADSWGLDVWDDRHASRCFVHLLNSAQFEGVTGMRPPTKPFTAAQYKKAGVPWFDFYQKGESLEGSEKLKGVKSVAEMSTKKGKPIPENEPISISGTIDLTERAALEDRVNA